VKRVQILQILWKSSKGYVPAGRIYSILWSNLSKNFSFGLLCPYRCTDRGEIWQGGGTEGPFLLEILLGKFHPIGATCRPCGRKSSKSASE